MEEVLLNGRFQMLPACSMHYDVSLSRKNIMFVENTSFNGRQRKLVSILMDNIIGCKLYNSKLSRDVCSYFKVITLRRDKKNIRQKQSFTFRVNRSDVREENYEVAENWACMINWLLHDPNLSAEDLKAKDHFPPQKRYFVVINPKSGPGKSLQVFRNIIQPLFHDSNVKYEVFVTEYCGHLTDTILTFDHTRWDGIVICSGDGLVYEVINGIMRRPDWREALKLPIGILPTGSGNALCASILFSAKEKFSIMNAAYVLLKGRKHPMDLFSVSTQQHSHFAFLSVSWGIMSDIDIESEKLRAIGPLRFTIGAINRIFNLRHYGGIFSYLPSKGVKEKDFSRQEFNENESSCSSSSEEIVQQMSSEGGSLESCDVNDSPPQSLSNKDMTDNIQKNNNPSLSNNSSSVNGFSSTSNKNKSKESVKLYGPASTIPPLNEPVPEDWVTVDAQFINIILSSLSHIGSDMHNSPGACIDDGVINLQYIKQGPKTGKMLKLLTSFETGKHVELPEVEVDNIRAFRLTPAPDHQGNIAVDGELIDYKPIQGEVFPSLANVIMLPANL